MQHCWVGQPLLQVQLLAVNLVPALLEGACDSGTGAGTELTATSQHCCLGNLHTCCMLSFFAGMGHLHAASVCVPLAMLTAPQLRSQRLQMSLAGQWEMGWFHPVPHSMRAQQ